LKENGIEKVNKKKDFTNKNDKYVIAIARMLINGN